MEPRSLLGLFLFVHIGSAIIAFGPSFAMPIIGAMGGRNPAHVNFAVRVSYTIASRLVLPLALLVGISGLGLIWAGGWDVTRQLWLIVAMTLYLISLGLSFFVALPTARRLIEATSGGPPPGPPPGGVPSASGPPSGPPPGGVPSGPSPGPSSEGAPAGPPGGPPPAGARAGPPPHIAALVRRSRLTGLALMGLVLVILSMMVFKPTL